MNAIDWAFLAILLGSVLLGIWRGLVWEVMAILGWVLALWLTPQGVEHVAPWLNFLGSNAAVRMGAAYVLIFIAILVVWALISNLLKKMVSAIGLRPIDRSLGALFGLLRGALVLLLITAAVHVMNIADSQTWQTSFTAKLCETALQTLKPMLPPAVSSHL